MDEIVKSKVFKLAHEISKRNVFACAYKKTSLKKAWKIVKLKKYICDKCYNLAKDFNRTDNEKRTNLKSIENYIEKLYEMLNDYHILSTDQEICLLDIKFKTSTMIFNDDYSNYNKLLKKISMKLILMCSNF